MESVFLVPITLFIGIFTMLIFLRKYENEERMAMIEKGINPHGLNPGGTKSRLNPSGTLRFALLAIGAGIGLLVGNVLENMMRFEEGIAYIAMVLVFGGLGLLASYVIQLKQDEKEKRAREREIV